MVAQGMHSGAGIPDLLIPSSMALKSVKTDKNVWATGVVI